MDINELADVFGDKGVDFFISGNEIAVVCPLCTSQDRKKKLYINPEKELFHCFRCGEGGRLRLILTILIGKALDEDREERGRVCIKKRKKAKPDRGRTNWKGSPYGEMALEYLESRGVPYNMVTSLGLSFCTEGKYRDRIRFPVCNLFGEEQFWFYRAFIDGVEPKVTSPLSGDTPMNKSNVLFGWSWVIPSPWRRIFIVEGEFDALTIYPYAVALLGSSMSIVQESLLTQKIGECTDVYVALDEDKKSDAYIIARRLAVNFDRVFFVPLGERDPNALGRHGFLKYVERRQKRVA